MNVADYCYDCTFPFKLMGACPHPNYSVAWAYISMIPYFVPFFILFTFIISRKINHLKGFLLIVSAYLIADKLLKYILRSN